MLTANSLHLVRGDFRLAVDELRLSEGSCVGLVGPNGAGKTTILDILGGRLKCRSAVVELDGVPLAEFGVIRSLAVGVMPDRLHGIRTLTVRKHFALRAQLFPSWDSDYQQQLVERLEIPLDKKLTALSKGTQAKVALVSVEAYRPPVLLLDEPTTGLDPIVRRELRTVLATALRVDPLRSILFSTHLVEDLQDMADRVALIRDGRLLPEVALPSTATREERGRLLEGALDLIAGEGQAA